VKLNLILKAMITNAVPKLPFIEKQETVDYYVRLGFSLQSDYGDYVIMKRDNAELHFFSYPELEPTKSDFMIYLRVDQDIEEMYRQFQDVDTAIHPNGELEEKPWGQKEFAMLDPNGTLLTFGEAL
jgi:uncharacterized glyoxalase superfamily protein PhnB